MVLSNRCSLKTQYLHHAYLHNLSRGVRVDPLGRRPSPKAMSKDKVSGCIFEIVKETLCKYFLILNPFHFVKATILHIIVVRLLPVVLQTIATVIINYYKQDNTNFVFFKNLNCNNSARIHLSVVQFKHLW